MRAQIESSPASAGSPACAQAPSPAAGDWLVVGFTGHRRLADGETIRAALAQAVDRLSSDGRRLMAVASAASGADTLFLEEIASRSLPLRLILPFPIARFREDFSEAEWHRVQPLLKAAIVVEELTGLASDEQAFLETGVLTVDRCDVLLAVWDKQPARGAGGTAEVVEYARSIDRPLLLIDAETGAINSERLEQLDASRDPSVPVIGGRDDVAGAFAQYDSAAARQGPRARQLLLRIILLHLFAAGVALVPLVFGLHGWLNTLGILLELAALARALMLVMQRHGAHHEWLECRFRAELCRIFLTLWQFPRSTPPFPSLVTLRRHPLFRKLERAWYADGGRPAELDAVRQQYLDGRISDQIDYFNRRYRSEQRRAERLKRAAQAATIGAIVCAALALVMALLHQVGVMYALPKLLSLLLPLISAAALSIAVSNDVIRRAVRSREMSLHLEGAVRRVRNARTWPSLARVCAEMEELLLQELIEWRALTQFAGESH